MRGQSEHTHGDDGKKRGGLFHSSEPIPLNAPFKEIPFLMKPKKRIHDIYEEYFNAFRVVSL